MADPITPRPRQRNALHIVPPPASPTREQIKTAVRLYRCETAPRAIRRANARKWLRAMEVMGDKHVLKGYVVTWGARQRDVQQPKAKGKSK